MKTFDTVKRPVLQKAPGSVAFKALIIP